jgi:ATP-dependent Clp protease ATP-binding subunit ClpC
MPLLYFVRDHPRFAAKFRFMPQLDLQATAIVRSLSEELLLAEALLFPGASCLAGGPAPLRRMLAKRVRAIVRSLAPGDIHRYRHAEPPEVRELVLAIPPLRNDPLRTQPVSLRFHYLVRRHAADAVIATVPALGIEVLAEDERQLNEQLEPQIRSALARCKTSESLRSLVMLDRIRRVRIHPLRLRIKLPTLKQAADDARDDSSRERSTLKETTVDLTAQESSPLYERDALVARLARLCCGPTPRSVLLVGPSGVGKTALVREAARRDQSLAATERRWWSTSGSRLIAGMSGFGMWQERCRKLIREAGKTGAIVHLDNLIELIEVGKGGGDTRGLASMLGPAIARGELLAICECTPEQLALIERDEPHLLEAFAKLDVPEPTPDETRSILAHAAAAAAKRGLPAIADAALAELDRLHGRYATYSAAPGRQLRFLRDLLEDHRGGGALATRHVTAAFSHETGLPIVILDDTLPLDWHAVRARLARQVMGQPEPVELVTDLLAAIKAGLTRGGKPIASLLFIGPTGVGKTEMAKALAEFLYQDPGRMIRFDMSEYAHPAAVGRLIGDDFSSQGLLTRKVRDQPFMVVLLDEIEKAHDSLFDILLQVLGEGRLTDGGGRVADFTNSVVVMTSNLGAESFGRLTAGFAADSTGAATAAQHFEREVRNFLRPEMFNRLDRIVGFGPLGADVIGEIARREIQRAAERDGLRVRDARLEVSPAAVARLASVGYDPKYGARPLKRVIERQLVVPLAERLCRLAGRDVRAFRAEVVDGALTIDAEFAPPGRGAEEELRTAAELQKVLETRRKIQALLRSNAMLRLRNEIARLHQFEKQRKATLRRRGREDRFTFTPEQARILAQGELLTASEKLLDDICVLEDQTCGEYYAHRPCDVVAAAEQRSELDQALADLLFQIYRLQSERRGTLTIAVYAQQRGRGVELIEAYEHVCAIAGAGVDRYWLRRYDPQLDEKIGDGRAVRKTAPAERPVLRLLHRKRNDEDVPAKVVDVYRPEPHRFRSPPEGVIGFALQIRDDRAIALLETEAGRHEFLRAGGGKPDVCFVEIDGGGRLFDYSPPIDCGRAGSFADLALRRTYDLADEVCRDPLLEAEVTLRGRSIPDAVAQATADYLVKRTWRMLD